MTGYSDETGSYCCSDKHERLDGPDGLGAKLAEFWKDNPPLPDGVVPDDDDGLTCDCDHRHPKRGWKGKLPVPVDGNTWPLDFAAKMLGVSEKDLRDLVRILRIEPEGTMKMASYRRSGRHPRVYKASVLMEVWETISSLADDIENL